MHDKQKKIMILGAGQMQVPIIKKCNELNLCTIAVDFDNKAPGFKYSDLRIFLSTHDKEGVLKEAKKLNIDGVLTTSDFPVRTVAYLSEKLNLNGLSQRSALISTDKYLLREILKEKKLNYPKYVKVIGINDLSKIDFFPAIIKPIDSSASRGVKKVNTKEELYNEYEISKSFSTNGIVIVEEYINGKEYSIESISVNGKHKIIAITEKITIGKENGYFVEYAHKLPAELNTLNCNLILKTTNDGLTAIELENSLSHTEIVISNKKAYIIEIGARLGGDFIGSDLVCLSTGIDMLKNVISLSIGEKLDLLPKLNKFSGIQFIIPKNYYSAKKFLKQKSKDIVDFELNQYRKITIKNSLDRLGYIIFTSHTREGLSKIFKDINNED
jgi:carbamoyl-phosphate synthase large subunit